MGCGRKSLCVDEYSSQAGNLFRRSPFARLLFLFYLVPLDMFPPSPPPFFILLFVHMAHKDADSSASLGFLRTCLRDARDSRS